MSTQSGSEDRDYFVAHKFSSYNREQIQESEQCGCFCCLSVFPSNEIEEWVDKDSKDVGQTALCPRCGTDSVLAEKAGYPLTPEFLKTMKEYWFKRGT